MIRFVPKTPLPQNQARVRSSNEVVTMSSVQPLSMLAVRTVRTPRCRGAEDPGEADPAPVAAVPVDVDAAVVGGVHVDVAVHVRRVHVAQLARVARPELMARRLTKLRIPRLGNHPI